jgi:hypothetical protein
MIAKKIEHEVCGYWPNAHCPSRVVGYTIFESQRDDKRVALCFAHFQDAQVDNEAYRRRLALLQSSR